MQKVPSKDPGLLNTIIIWLSTFRGELCAALVAALVAFLRGAYNCSPRKKLLLDSTLCAFMAGGIKDVLRVFNLDTSLVFICSVFIGVLGMDYISKTLKNKINKNKNEKL